ncbi:MAG: OmpA family protein [Muribaculaceae bacterium]|nr:OmpA family protein [Muribaculaceae bacterium]MDE7095883.1 OmpA family protein [Muribaculaceae bacterium]
MKFKALSCVFLAVLMLVTGCNVTNTGKGAAIGGGSGAALGAGIGALLGKGKGAGIGAGVGAAVGTAVGAIIGKHMDNQQKKLEEQLKNAEVEKSEVNGLQAIKVTFPGGILFATGKWNIQPAAQAELAEFAKSLEQNPLTDVVIGGYTDNTGSMEANTRVADNRANAVKTFLEGKGIAASRIQAKGFPMQDYVASNDTKEGQAKNRRVEVYIYASDEMVKAAENGNLN